MATIIRVDEVRPADNSDTANVFSNTAGSSVMGKVPRGSFVQVIADLGGMTQIRYASKNGYMKAIDLKKGTSAVSQQQANAAKTLYGSAVRQTADYTKSQYGEKDNKAYDYAMDKFQNAFGMPPHLNMDVDIQYDDISRVQTSTIYTNPSILSICPGAVDFLPGWNQKEKDNFFAQLQTYSKGQDELLTNLAGDKSKVTGKLYTFKSAFTDYVNIFNALCRASAIMMGIGDQRLPKTTVLLKNFDYGYWLKKNKFKFDNKDGKRTSIFASFWDAAQQTLQSAMNDNIYMHYFLMNSETSYSESVNTGTEPSAIETAVNDSNISSLAKNLNYLFGGAVGDSTLQEAWDELGGTSGLFPGDGFLSRIGNAAMNYLNGARMVIPDMLGDIQWETCPTLS